MAYASSRYGYHRQQTDSALDNKRPAFVDDDDDSAVLDPSILDAADIMQSPNNGAFRKNSFANSNGVLTPADSQAWDHQYNGALSVEPASAGATNPYHEGGPAYMRQNNLHQPAFPPQQHAPQWAFDQGAGDCTPTTGVGFIPPSAPFDSAPYQRNDSVHGAFSHGPPPAHFNVSHPEPGFIPAPQVQTPMSPQTHADWMTMAQQEMEGRPSSQKRMRPGSPMRSMIDFQRRDGIRKKNGRIDIPQERNIQTIDDLIEKTTDDELLKELKQQKRLLRNREAALASRQRKKKHTEDLEVKEKSYAQQIAMLESQLNEANRGREVRERDLHVAHERLHQAQRVIDTMHEEKRELIVRHNEEASTLRKRVQLLTEQLEQLEVGGAPAMSTVPSSTGFTDFNAEMEALHMEPHDWDSFILANEFQNEGLEDFALISKPEAAKPAPTLEKKVSTATISPQPNKKNNDNATEQPIASGLLFMLLLCGAFVASKPANQQPPEVSRMPPDVRAAAPMVLSNLLSDSGSSNTHDQNRIVARRGQEMMASNVQQINPRTSRMDRMHRTITAPSKQQEADQAFSLTTAQYASMTNVDYSAYSQHPAPSHSEPAPLPRRNLAEALANLENENLRSSSKAEVYTRSLLWDQIPADVVRQFKEIVRDHNELEARQQGP
ncbi:hypothetical protein DOTSEDRAFT_40499 [Dothistroma septosporum NZE10]|uniref:BZIP domain-containing protein n=1 Tax=Dothistroma septosporum (strain NZE10 / CBS 128990) TaxID=675120 RepID=N1Q0F7_DOTSN|nr:hypothetical protein DOTSEDRAFT_40499 [Dothistroma septosporum NZE10]